MNSVLMDRQFGRGKQGVADVGDDDVWSKVDVIESGAIVALCRGSVFNMANFGFRGIRGFAGHDVGFGQASDKFCQEHVVEMMMPMRSCLAGGVDALRRIEIGGEDAEVHIGHERAEQDHAVAGLHERAHRFTPHGAFIDPKI